MSILVLKFGGTSVGSVDLIKSAAQIIKKEYEAGHNVAVVVSAMSGTTNKLIENIYDLLIENKVLFFRNQNIKPKTQINFAKLFGQIEPPHPVYPHVKNFPEIVCLKNDYQKPPDTDVWHTDLTFKPFPPFASILYSKIIPEFGGFVSNRKSAQLSKTTGTLTPPSKKILFNPNLKTNDGLLISHIANNEGVNLEIAKKYVEIFSNESNTKLNNTKVLRVEKIGLFTVGKEGNILFLQDL